MLRIRLIFVEQTTKVKKKNRKLETKTNKTYSDQNLIDDVDHVIMYFFFCYFCIQRPKTWSVFFF